MLSICWLTAIVHHVLNEIASTILLLSIMVKAFYVAKHREIDMQVSAGEQETIERLLLKSLHFFSFPFSIPPLPFSAQLFLFL